jgi:SAM-dependent methyltransferase
VPLRSIDEVGSAALSLTKPSRRFGWSRYQEVVFSPIHYNVLYSNFGADMDNKNSALFMLDCLTQELKRLVEGLRLVSTERSRLARRYLRGSGIEIGALNNPLRASRKANVLYVDKYTKDQLYKRYPELVNKRLVNVDIIDDAETLLRIPDCSQDFLIANHLFEHTQNTFKTMANFLRVLRPNGCLFMAIPEMRFSFDRKREPTSLEHLIRDYKDGPSWSKESHYDDWVENVSNLDGHQAELEKQRLMEMNYSIHYHAWTTAEIIDFLSYFNRFDKRVYQVECIERAGKEVIIVLRKV